jgi:ornithine carbamoyltransferase
MLADFLTMHESSHRPSDSIAYANTGDARSNVGRSLLMIGAIMGADVRICGARELWPPADVQDLAARGLFDRERGLTLIDDRKHAPGRPGLVYTAVRVSMGEPKDYPKRGRMAARARAVPVRASQAATITPNRNPPTWAENATPPPFALAENRP